VTDTARGDLERVLEDAVGNAVTPGLVAVVASGREGGDRLVASVGRASFYDGAPEVDARTIYDLASLTKALSTTMLAAVAVDAGKLALDETPWPAWPGVTVRHALQHTGGLHWWKPFFEGVPDVERGTPRGRGRVVDAVHATPVDHPPGDRTVYSDLGFIAMGALLEERLGDRLDRVFADAAREVYGDTGLTYVPIFEQAHHDELDRVAPTERCPWRGRVVHGQVHDDNAYAMGGVAGHAGLFGSALDVERAARAILGATGALRAFRDDRAPRCIGFDVADDGGTTGGVLGPRAFGHLGFTGTSLWIDPDDEGAIYILLTNRVHPDRDDLAGIRDLRIHFHRAAKTWLAS
jgi:CubicO group peptidase (beta-lactamase class C family)